MSFMKSHCKYFSFHRPQWHQPTRRGVRERPAPAGLDPAEDRGIGPQRGPALRHLAHPPSVQRLRVQDPGSVLRDRLYPSSGHWGQ